MSPCHPGMHILTKYNIFFHRQRNLNISLNFKYITENKTIIPVLFRDVVTDTCDTWLCRHRYMQHMAVSSQIHATHGCVVTDTYDMAVSSQIHATHGCVVTDTCDTWLCRHRYMRHMAGKHFFKIETIALNIH